jgi:MHS family proline/betaine transporter-like MFS transporter
MILLYLVSFIHPLKILKVKFLITFPLILICPFLFNLVSNPMGIMLIQAFIISCAFTDFPATPIFYKSYPVFKRFTGACLSYSIARGLMYVISSFGVIYLIKYFGNLGLLFLLVPVIVGYGYGLFHFLNLEKQKEQEEEDYIKKSLERERELIA